MTSPCQLSTAISRCKRNRTIPTHISHVLSASLCQLCFMELPSKLVAESPHSSIPFVKAWAADLTATLSHLHKQMNWFQLLWYANLSEKRRSAIMVGGMMRPSAPTPSGCLSSSCNCPAAAAASAEAACLPSSRPAARTVVIMVASRMSAAAPASRLMLSQLLLGLSARAISAAPLLGRNGL